MPILVKCNKNDVSNEDLFSVALPAERGTQLITGEEAFVWISETPRQGSGGSGLELRGLVAAWEPSGRDVTLSVQIAARLLGGRLRMNDLAALVVKSEDARTIYSRISPNRHRRIWSLSSSERDFLNSFFQEGQADSAQSTLADIEGIRSDHTVDATTRQALIDARCGQGRFRRLLESRWNGSCAVTGLTLPSLLRASHIKPWRFSTHLERLDPANGLFLAAHIDALFDNGFVSFDDNGQMLISQRMPAGEARLLQLPGRLRRELSIAEKGFLAHHRNHTFLR